MGPNGSLETLRSRTKSFLSFGFDDLSRSSHVHAYPLSFDVTFHQTAELERGLCQPLTLVGLNINTDGLERDAPRSRPSHHNGHGGGPNGNVGCNGNGRLTDAPTLYKARLLLAELVDPFEAHPHPDGVEFRAKLRRHATTPRDFRIPTRPSKFV